MNKQQRKNQDAKIIFHFESPCECTVESVRPGYHKVKFYIYGDIYERRDKFTSLFIYPETQPTDIQSRKELLIKRTIADVFNDFMDMAVHTPHQFKKDWKQEKKKWINKLDPMRYYQVWDILDHVSENID